MARCRSCAGHRPPGHPGQGRPNRHFPGLTPTFEVPLRQPNGNIVPAGTDVAGLFDVAGGETDAAGAVRITVDRAAGGSPVLPADEHSVHASVATDHAGTAHSTFSVSDTTGGQSPTPDRWVEPGLRRNSSAR